MKHDLDKRKQRQEIVNNWPDIDKVNPYLDIKVINKILEFLSEKGLYARANTPSAYEQPIRRMILNAQGVNLNRRKNAERK
jgi:hypothetical protein